MPEHEIWYVQDKETLKVLKVYDEELTNCEWSDVEEEGITYDTENDANDIIESWGEEPGEKFIGKNPPIR